MLKSIVMISYHLYNKTISHIFIDTYESYGNYIQSIRGKLQKLILEQDILACNLF